MMTFDNGATVLPPGEGKTVSFCGTFYVLEGTFGFQVGDRILEAPAGTFLFVPRELEHAFWNGGTTEARLLSTVCRPGFEDLAEGLAAAGDDVEVATSLRKALSEKYDIEVVGPPGQATN
jgi:glyoxylate utilization-related uncharacterized protein